MLVYLTYVFRLIKEINNPPLFLYHLFHYANRNMPKFIARIIKNINYRQYSYDNVGDILIETIDGSGQTVHPDIEVYNDRLVFIGTPYPYAMEEYENPCLYVGDSIDSLKMECCPLDVQYERIQGVHLSDPCIASDGEILYCIYRDTRRRDDYIYAKIVQSDNSHKLKFSDKRLLLEKKSEYALSPAVIIKENSLLMYYVETNKVYSKLVLNIYDKNSLEYRNHNDVFLNSEPEGFYLWHISVASSNGYVKFQRDKEILNGLFLYISIKESCNLKLYLASSNDNLHWEIENEISIPDKLMHIIKFPYKSCFIPNSDKILLSFRDRKNRNRLIELSLSL